MNIKRFSAYCDSNKRNTLYCINRACPQRKQHVNGAREGTHLARDAQSVILFEYPDNMSPAIGFRVMVEIVIVDKPANDREIS